MLAEEFRKHVKNALDHLQDPAALEVHPLLAQLVEPLEGNQRSAAQQLRAILIAGIEALRPSPDVAASSREWRCYRALRYRYVQGLSTQTVERELGIGGRQVHRELHKGLVALAALLWSLRIEMVVDQKKPLAPPTLSGPHISRHDTQGLVLLKTKLAPPRLPAALVVRERLLQNLDTALRHRLTLLSAAAGWGKTTLLSAWANRHAGQVGWVSLDELDNDLARFWITVMAALRTCVPALSSDALAMLHSPEQAPLTAILTVLLNDLASLVERVPILLILDDYHTIDDPAIHASLAFMIEHLPTQLHLVLASRLDPDLPLARWRVRGELVEIRMADLRFTEMEATTFFTQTLGAEPAVEELRLLESRTQGWVAGLQLAALAMRQCEDRSAFVQAFTGSHRHLLDYVQEEILQRQPLPVQRFLLQTAVLRRMNAALCAALTEDTTSQAMLESLERNNLFVVHLDDGRDWYRLHDLFREVLLARLRTTEPALEPLLHGRAARWYAGQGEPREAIDHAMAAGDFDYAADLIERAAPQLWLRGEAHVVQSWIEVLPPAVLRQHARLALDAALRLLEASHATSKTWFVNVQAGVEATTVRVEELLREQPASSSGDRTLPALLDAEVVVLRRRIGLLRALMISRTLLTRGDAEGMRLLVQETEALAAQEELRWKMVARSIACWHTESLRRQGALLIPMLLEAKQQALVTRDHQAASRVMRWLAFAYMRAAKLHLLHWECQEALALIERSGEHSQGAGYLHFFLIALYYAWDRLKEASDALQQLLQIGHAWQQADFLIQGNMWLVTLCLARGDRDSANAALQRAEELVQQEHFATHVGGVQAQRVGYWLRTGNPEAAGSWAAQVVFSPEAWNPNRKWEFLVLVQVYVAQGRYVEAIEALERFRVFLDHPGDMLTTIEFLALQVVALHCAGKHDQARTVAVRLLELTAPEDFIRVYLDAGAPMQAVLQSLLDSRRDQENDLPATSIAFVSKLLAAFVQEARRGGQGALEQPMPASQSPLQPAEAPTEPLTRREQEVLRLLMTGASNQEIAGQLVISLATVKKHVSNLLGKLQVATRAQAIARARGQPDLP
jgi:LuxR family maltose regulon positive regulatory protein